MGRKGPTPLRGWVSSLKLEGFETREFPMLGGELLKET